jgi:hypothetical protein
MFIRSESVGIFLGLGERRVGGDKQWLLLVPLVYGVIVYKDRFDLNGSEEAMLVHCTIVNVESDDRFFRCYITGQNR